LRIAKAARDCEDIEDLRARLSVMKNKYKYLEFGNPEIVLDADRDPWIK
jgi:hypothetical protein